jgi:excisionase family DNA binding protein
VPVTSKSGELLTWAETAVALGMSVRTLQRLKRDGVIGSTRLAGKIYFSWDDIDAYIESQHTKPSRQGPAA